MIEKRMIAVTAYRTPGGEPTCATNFDTGEVCQFLTTRQFGLVEVCAVFGEDIKRTHSGKKYLGYLTPVNCCPVWAGAQS